MDAKKTSAAPTRTSRSSRPRAISTPAPRRPGPAPAATSVTASVRRASRWKCRRGRLRTCASTPASPMPTRAIVSDLVGTDDGSPLNQALRKLPGSRVSNAPSTVRPARSPGPRQSAARVCPACSTSTDATAAVQHRLRPVPAEEPVSWSSTGAWNPWARRPLGAGAVGAEPVRQELSAGRVQLAFPGRRGRRSVHRPAIPGRTADLLVLSVGAADLRPDAPRTVRGAKGGAG